MENFFCKSWPIANKSTGKISRGIFSLIAIQPRNSRKYSPAKISHYTVLNFVSIKVSFDPYSDILVFLTGKEEIESTQHLLQKCAKVLPVGCLDLEVCTLYAALPTEEQQMAFQPSKEVVM